MRKREILYMISSIHKGHRAVKIWIAILFIGLAVNVKSQIINLKAFGLSGVPDTVCMNDTINFSYYIVNPSLTDLINLGLETNMRMNGSAPSIIDLVNIPNLLAGDTVLIGVNDFVVGPLNSATGGVNIMVIWPSSGILIGSDDTLRDTIFVIDTCGPVLSRTESTQPDICLSPNPAADHVRIIVKDPALKPREIIIFDAFGSKIGSVDNPEERIDLLKYPPGIYFALVTTSDERTITRKFVIQR